MPQENSIWSPTQNRWIEPAEVSQFLSSNPSQQQILSTASNLGLTQADLGVALRGQNLGDVEMGRQYNTLANNLFSGGLGFSTAGSNGGFYSSDGGRIHEGGGNHQVPFYQGGQYIGDTYAPGAGTTVFGSDGNIVQGSQSRTNPAEAQYWPGGNTGGSSGTSSTQPYMDTRGTGTPGYNGTGMPGLNGGGINPNSSPYMDTSGTGNPYSADKNQIQNAGSTTPWGGPIDRGSPVTPVATSTPSTSSPMNPYLDQMAQSITNQVNDNWTRTLAPSLRSGAVAAGGFGGSRQGVTEANGLRDLNQGLSNSLSNMYGTAWQNQQQNEIQRQSLANQMAMAQMQNSLGYSNLGANYDLGLRNNNLGFANLDSNNAQFGANYGLNVLNSQNNWANNGVNAANQLAQMPTQYRNLFNNMQNQIAGQGGTTSASQNNPGNPAIGALGGMQLVNSLFR